MIAITVERQIQDDDGLWSTFEREVSRHETAVRTIANGWVVGLEAGERLIVKADEVSEEEYRQMREDT